MLLSKDENRWIADYVHENNLKKTNALACEVHPKDTIYTRYIKRGLDIAISLSACLVTLPLNFVLGVCTAIDVGKPIFFFQKRIGKGNKDFTIAKFRNMRIAKDEHGDDLPINQRVTKFGLFVRKTSLDELLNFYSVLKGDMSIIGPRPLPVLYLDRFSKRHLMRHSVRPGLECPDLSTGGYNSDWHSKLENDIWYVENVSFLVDCKMVLFLVRMVFDKKTRKEHAGKGVGSFLGYDENGHAFGALDIPEEYVKLLRHEEEDQESVHNSFSMA